MAGRIVSAFGALPPRQKPIKGSFIGPTQPRSAPSTTGELIVDLSPALKKIEKVLSEAAELIGKRSVNSALYQALNYATGGAYARITRDLVNQTGAPLNRIRAVVREVKASPSRLEWRLKASDKAMRLIDFAPRAKPGQKNPTARPWNRSQKFRHAFVVSFGGQLSIVKATNGPGHKHPRGGALNAKVLWGPIVPKEMIRKNSQTYQDLLELVPKVLEPKLLERLEDAIAQAINSAK